MLAIATVTVEASACQPALDEELDRLGFGQTLPSSEGGTLTLPRGMYGRVVETDDLKDQMNTHYQELLNVMRKHHLHGRYFVSVSREMAFVCGKL